VAVEAMADMSQGDAIGLDNNVDVHPAQYYAGKRGISSWGSCITLCWGVHRRGSRGGHRCLVGGQYARSLIFLGGQ